MTYVTGHVALYGLIGAPTMLRYSSYECGLGHTQKAFNHVYVCHLHSHLKLGASDVAHS